MSDYEENSTTFGNSEQYYEPIETSISDACTNCGTSLNDGQEFCPKCGTRKGAPKKNICNKCGVTLQEGQEFCPNCGQKTELTVDAPATTKINQTIAVAKNKKKLLIIAVAVVVAILIGVFINGQMQAKAKDSYISNVNIFKTKVLTAGTNLEDISDTIQKYWHENIYDDKHGSNIDSAISSAMTDKSEEIIAASTQKNGIDTLYKNVKSVPDVIKDDEYLKEICNKAKELYNIYTDYYSFATNPTGNYNSYSGSNSEKTDMFLSKYRVLDNLLN